jgi:hypothetical protein
MSLLLAALVLEAGLLQVELRGSDFYYEDDDENNNNNSEAQNLLGCTAVFLIGGRHPIKNTATSQKNFILAAVRTLNLTIIIVSNK